MISGPLRYRVFRETGPRSIKSHHVDLSANKSASYHRFPFGCSQPEKSVPFESLVIRAILQRSKAVKHMFFRSDLAIGDETCTVDGETLFLGLPALSSRTSDCCGRKNFFAVKTERSDQALQVAAQATNISDSLISRRLMPN